MKIRKKAILMVLVVFCLNFTAFAQNINLNLNNVTVKKAMETLKEENGYSFVFASGDINTQKVIRVKVNNGTIDQVVKQILQDQKVSYEIKNKNIIAMVISCFRNNPCPCVNIHFSYRIKVCIRTYRNI